MKGLDPPRNVRAVLADGTVVPLDCVYVGVHDGLDVWETTWALPEPPEHVLIEQLPAKCSVSVKIEQP